MTTHQTNLVEYINPLAYLALILLPLIAALAVTLIIGHSRIRHRHLIAVIGGLMVFSLAFPLAYNMGIRSVTPVEYTSQTVTVVGLEMNDDMSFDLKDSEGHQHHVEKMNLLLADIIKSKLSGVYYSPEGKVQGEPTPTDMEILCLQERCVAVSPKPNEAPGGLFSFIDALSKDDEGRINERREEILERVFFVSLSSTDPHLSL